jgi:hypothetical protein
MLHGFRTCMLFFLDFLVEVEAGRNYIIRVESHIFNIEIQGLN